MAQTESFIEGTEKLTRLMGSWPSFHDAEIIELNLRRKGVVLTLKIHVFEMTREVDSAGYYVLRNHSLVTLCFYELDDFEMNNFNQGNIIFGLDVQLEDATQASARVFSVCISSSYGMEANFKCARIEVTDAVRCSSKGDVLPDAN